VFFNAELHVVMIKCFALNPIKILTQTRLVVFEKNAKTTHFNSEKFSGFGNYFNQMVSVPKA